METLEFLTERVYALSSDALNCAALIGKLQRVSEAALTAWTATGGGRCLAWRALVLFALRGALEAGGP